MCVDPHTFLSAAPWCPGAHELEVNDGVCLPTESITLLQDSWELEGDKNDKTILDS